MVEQKTTASRGDMWAALVTILLTLIGGTLTLWGKVSAHSQQLSDMQEELVLMHSQLDRIEQQLERGTIQ